MKKFDVPLLNSTLRGKPCLVTNIAHIPPYVLLMAELQQVIDLSVNDHVLRNTAGFCRHNLEL